MPRLIPLNVPYIFSVVLALLGLPPLAMGQPQAPPAAPGTSSPSSTTTVAAPVYHPPSRGTPGGRVGGGTRGKDQTFTLSVLAPNHTALTTQEQPTLYWFVSKPISTPLVFTLTDNGPTPLVEQVLTPPFEGGVHRIRLADFGARLATGKQYRWFVTLISDPKRRSKDILAGATVERVEPSSTAMSHTVQVGSVETVHWFAEAGQWYDALAAISELIASAPNDPALRSHRAALLRQVGLVEIAEFDAAAK